MRVRVELEKADFDRSAASVLAVRSVHLKQLRDVFKLLGSTSISPRAGGLEHGAARAGLKPASKCTRASTTCAAWCKVQLLEGEIHSMLGTSFRQLQHRIRFFAAGADHARHGPFQLDAVERSHLQYLGVGSA